MGERCEGRGSRAPASVAVESEEVLRKRRTVASERARRPARKRHTWCPCARRRSSEGGVGLGMNPHGASCQRAAAATTHLLAARPNQLDDCLQDPARHALGHVTSPDAQRG